MARLAEYGVVLTEHQLANWRRLGLIPRPNVRRIPTGGSIVEPNSEITEECMMVLSGVMRPGRAWQVGPLCLFEELLPVSEPVLRETLRWFAQRTYRSAATIWDRAAREQPPQLGLSAEELLGDIAERAAALARSNRTVRGFRRLVRDELKARQILFDDSDETRQLVHEVVGLRLAAMVGADLSEELTDIARYSRQGRAPKGELAVLPHEYLQCVETVTLRELYAVGRRWDAEYAAMGIQQEIFDRGLRLLDIALTGVAATRLSTPPYDVSVPLGGASLRSLERLAAEWEQESLLEARERTRAELGLDSLDDEDGLDEDDPDDPDDAAVLTDLVARRARHIAELRAIRQEAEPGGLPGP